MPRTSSYVFTSGSSVVVSSTTSTQATTHGIFGQNATHQAHGSVSVSHDGVSLEATFHVNREGLRIFVRGFDLDHPEVTPIHEWLTLQVGERRVIHVPRGGGKPAMPFTIIRVGDGVQILAGVAST
jgi:hypothetical protein